MLYYKISQKSKNKIILALDFKSIPKKDIFALYKSKNQSSPKVSKIHNIILFAFIFLLLFKNTSQENYIGIKVNAANENQIISEQYNNVPTTVKVGSNSVTITNKKIPVSSPNLLIKLFWSRNFDNFSYMFNGLTNIIYAELSGMFNLNKIYLSYMFAHCTNLISVKILDDDIEYIVNMQGMFYNCVSLKSVYFQTSNPRVSLNYIDLSYMFYNCKNFITFGINIYNFKVSNAREMFYNCISLGSFIFSPYLVSSPIDMSKMFYNCKAITHIEFSINYCKNRNCGTNSYFQPTDMSFMFYNCNSLVSLTFNCLYTDNTKYMSYMLYNCKRLTKELQL